MADGGRRLPRADLIKEHGGQNIRWENAASPLLEGGLLYVAGGGKDQSIPACSERVGRTEHYIQEDAPTEIVAAIRAWAPGP